MKDWQAFAFLAVAIYFGIQFHMVNWQLGRLRDELARLRKMVP